MTRSPLIIFALASLAVFSSAVEKPNILWITSEDNASHWLGCYGNKQVKTPRLDALAKEGVRFQHAYSNAPVCAVARSTILNGVYAPTQGTQHMRSRYPIPDRYLPYVHYLRKAGYYCTNSSKTDYNFKGNDQAIWDECSGKAHYRSRGKDQPFFAIFNLTVSHESSLFGNPGGGKKKDKGGAKPGLSPDEVEVPPYLPDLPEIRHDLAAYHGIMEKLDGEVGWILDELTKDGLAENTIVFYYSDHGGILPRGKRYLEDTGVRVPMIVHVPEKWRHLCPFGAGSAPAEPLAFVDLAPTVLSLAGVGKPEHMQGRAFLGEKRTEPAADAMAYLYADRFDEMHSGMRRGLTDGRWKYIRRFYPHLPAAPYSFYQFGQSGWRGWKAAWEGGKLPEKFNRIWESPQPVEELFDTEADPWEVHNLAGDPAHVAKLEQMRSALKERMVSYRDSSVIPEPMFGKVSGDGTIADLVESRQQNLPGLVDLMFAASSGESANLGLFQKKLASDDLLSTYWATVGCLVLGKEAESSAEALKKLTKAEDVTLRITAAHALARMGHDTADLIVAELAKDPPEMVVTYALTALTALNATDRIPEDLLKGMANSAYASRFAKEIASLRKSAE